MIEFTTRRLRVDEDGGLYLRADPDDDDGDDEWIGSIEDAYCVPDELGDEYEILCNLWRREVGALQRDVDQDRAWRYER